MWVLGLKSSTILLGFPGKLLIFRSQIRAAGVWMSFRFSSSNQSLPETEVLFILRIVIRT